LECWFALVAAGGEIATSVAASGSGKSAGSENLYLTLVSPNGFFVDNDPSGSSAGDLFGGAGPLKQGGKRVGRFVSSCIATATKTVLGQCAATFSLNGRGDLELAGKVNPGAPGPVAIVGGTGSLKRAAGDVQLRPIGDGSRRSA
jgi:hypothetical protein